MTCLIAESLQYRLENDLKTLRMVHNRVVDTSTVCLLDAIQVDLGLTCRVLAIST